MADTFRRITRVVMGSTDDSQEGVWLDDGSRLVMGKYEVTTRAVFVNQPAMQEITIHVTDPSVDVEIHPLTYPAVIRSAQGEEIL